MTASVPLRVLVVDDNEASAKTLGWMMELSGHQVRLATDGSTAIEVAREFLPQAVLLDIGLPIMNGYELCGFLRAELKDAVFIAQTGWGQAEHRQRSKEAGFHFHLVKPIQMQQLQEIMENISKELGSVPTS